MHIVGLITEYNPFHNGHLYHLNKSKEITGADYSIAVMSGNYVQRGCPAYVDKWTRAEMALKTGVDMVIEIPTYYATATADLFAFGSVALLHHTGIVNSICFGSEEGKTPLMQTIAKLLSDEPENYQQQLKSYLKEGHGFANSRTKALFDYLKSHNTYTDDFDTFKNFIGSPNNILGIEYMKWLHKLKSPIQAATIQRKASGYHEQDTTNTISSASGIRNSFNTHGDLSQLYHTMPQATLKGLEKAFQEGRGPITFDDYSNLLHYAIITLGTDGVQKIMEVAEGLENRIYKKSQQHHQVSQLLESLGTKRYTNSRLSRALLYTLLGITREGFLDYHQAGGPQYLKVLGFRKDSELLFKMLKERASLPLVTNMGRHVQNLPPKAYEMLKDEIRFTDIYSLGYRNHELKSKDLEFQRPFIVV